jgi:8-oxo-dGTP diphosphatase
MDKKQHIVAITAVVKNKKGDRFLIIKRNLNEVAYPGKWALPGGKVEMGETIMDTLKREVKEEVGIEIEDDKRFLLDFTFTRPDGINVIGLCFLVRPKSEKVLLSEDFDEYRWITPAELKELDHIEGMEKEVGIAFGRGQE